MARRASRSGRSTTKSSSKRPRRRSSGRSRVTSFPVPMTNTRAPPLLQPRRERAHRREARASPPWPGPLPANPFSFRAPSAPRARSPRPRRRSARNFTDVSHQGCDAHERRPDRVKCSRARGGFATMPQRLTGAVKLLGANARACAARAGIVVLAGFHTLLEGVPPSSQNRSVLVNVLGALKGCHARRHDARIRASGGRIPDHGGSSGRAFSLIPHSLETQLIASLDITHGLRSRAQSVAMRHAR
jgi:hypothetical protein